MYLMSHTIFESVGMTMLRTCMTNWVYWAERFVTTGLTYVDPGWFSQAATIETGPNNKVIYWLKNTMHGNTTITIILLSKSNSKHHYGEMIWVSRLRLCISSTIKYHRIYFRIIYKMLLLLFLSVTYLFSKFRENPPILFWVILLSNRQTSTGQNSKHYPDKSGWQR